MSEVTKHEVSFSSDNGFFLDQCSAGFEAGAAKMIEQLNTAQKNLEKDPSNPSVLAQFQAKLQEYTLFRNAQTSTVKAYKDIGSTIIQNFR